MLVQTHIAAGALAGAAVATHLGTPLPAQLVAAALGGVAATLPDLDHPSSFATRRVAGGGLVSALRHRGPTHSITALAGFAFLLPWIADAAGIALPSELWLAAEAGYASHLVTDLLTVEGLQLLWPFLPQKVRLPLLACSTGSAGEVWFWRPLFSGLLGLILMRGVG